MNDRPYLSIVQTDNPKDAAPAATFKIVMSDREPVLIVEADWPVIATLTPTDILGLGTEMFIRQHKDGRRIAYGWNSQSRHGEGTRYAGHILKAKEDATRTINLLVMEMHGTSTHAGLLLAQLPGKALR